MLVRQHGRCSWRSGNTDRSLRERIVSILKDADHGQAILDDLRSGLSALPEWMRMIVRDLLQQANAPRRRRREAEALQTRAGTGPNHQESEGISYRP